MPTKEYKASKLVLGLKNIQAWIPEETHTELKILCEMRGWWMQDCIAEACRRFLRQELSALRVEGREEARVEQDMRIGFREEASRNRRPVTGGRDGRDGRDGCGLSRDGNVTTVTTVTPLLERFKIK